MSECAVINDKKAMEIIKTESGQEIMNFKFPMLKDSEHPERRVRVIQDENGEPWFVAKDVCDILGLTNPSETLTRLDDDEKADISLAEVSSNGVKQKRNRKLVNEPGLYSLILRSDKAQAKRFKRWITHDVLPTIRKTGGYIHATPEMSDAEIMARALKVADTTLERVKEERDRLLKQNVEISLKNVKFRKQTEAMEKPAPRSSTDTVGVAPVDHQANHAIVDRWAINR
ncbi:hypothetical protein DPQ33_04220 [Oceanidesulfovibrio indonesiensis]|uniref:Bro-N domain-containing protein n=1 Tax=Oceanidesulfovibrio indonesiensis TaxID=54767 RepID=A0A7M3MGU4_9BACT|nr:Bro-N domain-containing protein [Oceanidesulfovibrio indonesiensis]TVM18689.1 hypothetical protein DPQ33_04220 [Oceanidesulfovibrio indonesiensis]